MLTADGGRKEGRKVGRDGRRKNIEYDIHSIEREEGRREGGREGGRSVEGEWGDSTPASAHERGGNLGSKSKHSATDETACPHPRMPKAHYDCGPVLAPCLFVRARVHTVDIQSLMLISYHHIFC